MSHAIINYPSDDSPLTKVVAPDGDLNASAAALNASVMALTDAITSGNGTLTVQQINFQPSILLTNDGSGGGMALGDAATAALTTVSGRTGQVQYSMPFATANYKKFVLNAQNFTPAPGPGGPKFGSGMLYIPGGSNDFCSAPAIGPYALTGDFTIECWFVNLDGGGAIVSIWSDQVYPYWVLQAQSANTNMFIGAVVNAAVGPPVPPDGNWHHVCAERASGAINCYVDGVATTPLSYTGQVGAGSGAAPLALGIRGGVSNATLSLIDEFRISNVARYTPDGSGHITPPTAPFTSDGNTVCLLHFDGDETDYSSYGNTFTNSGAAAVIGSYAGSQITIDYPLAFANAPYLYGDAAGSCSTTTTALTVSGSNITGNVFVEGF